MAEQTIPSNGNTDLDAKVAEEDFKAIVDRFLEVYGKEVAARFIDNYGEDVGRAYIWSGDPKNLLESRQFLNGNFMRVADEVRTNADKPLADLIGYEMAKDLIKRGNFEKAHQVANGSFTRAAKDVLKYLEGRYNATGDETFLNGIKDVYKELGDEGKGIGYTQGLRTAYYRRLQKATDETQKTATPPPSLDFVNTLTNLSIAAGYKGR